VTAREWLRKYTSIFQRAGIDQASDEAAALLCYALCISKAQVLSQPEKTLDFEELALLNEMAVRRLRRQPSSYITGHREFFGLDLLVDTRVLIPRPETEVLVEAAIEFGHSWIAGRRRPIIVADIGTGCGAIAIALATHMPEAQIYAVDISPDALEVAASNVRRHGLGGRITLIQGNLLEKNNRKLDIIVANLPYIRSAELAGLQPEVYLHEPMLALDGGESGIESIKALLSQTPGKIAAGGALLLEIGAGQGELLIPIVQHVLPRTDVEMIKDLAGIDRCLKAVLIE